MPNNNDLKLWFASGTAATQAKFHGLIDSVYNKLEDSIPLGPSGITGINGVWYTIIGATPLTPTASGITGQIAIDNTGIWICNGLNNWLNYPIFSGPTGATGIQGPTGISQINIVTVPATSGATGNTGDISFSGPDFYFYSNDTTWYKLTGVTF